MPEFKTSVKTPTGDVPSTVIISDTVISVSPDGGTTTWMFNKDLTPHSIIQEEDGNETHITHDGKDLFESTGNNAGSSRPVKINRNYDGFMRSFETARTAIEQVASDPSFPPELREVLKQEKWSPEIKKLSTFAVKTGRSGHTL